MDVRNHTLGIMAATLATRVPINSRDEAGQLPVLTEAAMIACARQARELLDTVERLEKRNVL